MLNERAVYRLANLRRLIDPRIIAVVGASEARGSFRQRTLANLAGFGGKIFGVNPKYRELGSAPCFSALTELPEAPDCVVLCVARMQVGDSLQQAVELGAGGTIVYASGFAETGFSGRVVEQEKIVATARRSSTARTAPGSRTCAAAPS
jgi:acetyltransferase